MKLESWHYMLLTVFFLLGGATIIIYSNQITSFSGISCIAIGWLFYYKAISTV